MVFNSLIFIFIFLPIALIVYFISPKKIRNITLLVLSIIFYSYGEPVYILLLLATIIINYILSLWISNIVEDREKRKFIFVCGIIVNLFALFFFKYYGFFIDNINSVFHSHLSIRELPLPLGLSFYTFKAISYLSDIYTGKSKAQKNIVNVALYLSMFMQITAGPIEIYSNIEEEISNRKFSTTNLGIGVERFITGLFKKVFIADSISVAFQTIQTLDLSKVSVITAWLSGIFFAIEIYFDFSGYSDMAIGLGKMFGFDFKENFNYPYISKTMTEFWRRWHMSLGTWFRNYIYIPLGGNRVSKAKQIRNLFVVWFVTGFWHGASWSFIIWGLYFGVLILLEREYLTKLLEKSPVFISHIYSIIAIVIGWIIFSSKTLTIAFVYIKAMFGIGASSFIDKPAIYLISSNFIILVLGILGSTPIFTKIKLKYNLNKSNVTVVLKIILFIISIIYLTGQGYSSFLYTKF